MPTIKLERLHGGAEWIPCVMRASAILRFEQADQGERDQLHEHVCACFVAEMGHDTYGTYGGEDGAVETASHACRLIVRGKLHDLVDQWQRALLVAQGVPPNVHDRFFGPPTPAQPRTVIDGESDPKCWVVGKSMFDALLEYGVLQSDGNSFEAHYLGGVRVLWAAEEPDDGIRSARSTTCRTAYEPRTW